MSRSRTARWMATLLLVLLVLPSVPPSARAATTPSLGTANTFGILAHSFTYANSGTTITGDLGYGTTSGTGSVPSVSGATDAGNAAYAQAGSDQAAALASLNAQSCDFTLPFNVDLATYNSGIYAPGVYCVAGPATIGAGGITLSGSGTYLFRIESTLITADHSVVTLSGGASACDVFWTTKPGVVVTVLGAYSTFVGTLIEPDHVTVKDHASWTGRGLVYGGTLSVDEKDSISAPTGCSVPSTTGTLRVIKTFYNDYGGTAVPSDASIHVKNGAGDVVGSPQPGDVSPGTSYSLTADTYTVSEDAYPGYTAIFSGDCDADGHVVLSAGDDKTCTVSNDQDPTTFVPATLHVIKHVVNDNAGNEVASDFSLYVQTSGPFGLSHVSGSPAPGAESPGTSYSLAAGTYVVSEGDATGYATTVGGDCDADGNVTLSAGDDKTCTITNDDTPETSVVPATLRVVKTVVNDNGGTAVASEAVIHVMNGGMGDVTGSPQAGAAAPGTSYSLAAGSYNVSEDFFAGYGLKIAGDCDAGGDVELASGDDKTCTITNDDIATITEEKIPEEPPTETPEDPCDICGLLTYDLYIVNPDLSERHTGTAWVRVTSRGDNILRYAFEDKTLDPNDPLYDYNDSIIDVDFTDCRNVKFLFVSSDASWKHQVRIRVEINGVQQSDTLVTDDSRAVVGTMKAVDATKDVDIQLACSEVLPTNLLGRILLQVEQHGEAWYVHPRTGLRAYMKDGPTAYDMMRNMSLGITDVDLTAIPAVETVDELQSSNGACLAGSLGNSLKGWILLQVQQHGEAWYVDPTKCLRIYMKDGDVAYTLMRYLGLGITDADLAKIGIGT